MTTKSKNRPNHKAKVEQRNQRIVAAKNKIRKEFQARLAAEIAADEQKEREANGGDVVTQQITEAEVIQQEGNIRAATPEDLNSQE